MGAAHGFDSGSGWSPEEEMVTHSKYPACTHGQRVACPVVTVHGACYRHRKLKGVHIKSLYFCVLYQSSWHCIKHTKKTHCSSPLPISAAYDIYLACNLSFQIFNYIYLWKFLSYWLESRNAIRRISLSSCNMNRAWVITSILPWEKVDSTRKTLISLGLHQRTVVCRE